MRFAAVLSALLSISSLASGHMWLRTPLSRGGENFAGSTTGPCAGLASTSGTRAVFEAGSKATFAFRVNQHGPAPFKFLFSPSGSDNSYTVTLASNISNTVTAGPNDFQGVFVPVTIPDQTCDTCSVQLSGMGQNSGTGTWYNCANIKIVPKGSLGVPVVESVSPSSGPTSGGTLVTITGKNFGFQQSANLKCRFELALVDATWVNNNTIRCTSPPHNVNKEGVVEVTANGQTFSVSGKTFTYSGEPIPPVISSISPTSGKAGTKITITGQNFFSTSMLCKFDASYAEATVISTTSATCFVPTYLTEGPVTIEVNVDGSPYSTSGKSFTVGTQNSSSAMVILPQLALLVIAMFFVIFA